jgi:hypothetical protein
MADLGAHLTSLVGRMRFSRRGKSGSEMSWTFRDSLEQNERAKQPTPTAGIRWRSSTMSFVIKMLAVEQTYFLMTRHLDLIVEGNRHSLSFVVKPLHRLSTLWVFQQALGLHTLRHAHLLDSFPVRILLLWTSPLPLQIRLSLKVSNRSSSSDMTFTFCKSPSSRRRILPGEVRNASTAKFLLPFSFLSLLSLRHRR